MRSRQPTPLLLASALALAGCGHPAQTAHLKVTPAPADIPPAKAPEDRLYADAVKAIEQRDYDMALDILQTARNARPDDPRVLAALGVVYDKLGRFDLAGHYYDLAEKADPGSKVVAIDRRYSRMLQARALPTPPTEAR